jgi:hypothetical protein
MVVETELVREDATVETSDPSRQAHRRKWGDHVNYISEIPERQKLES